MGASLDEIERDYEGTAFEGISFVIDSHSDVVDFLSKSSENRPDNFVAILELLLNNDTNEFQSLLFANEHIHVLDVLRYILDLIDFFETSLITKLRSSSLDSDWEVYTTELNEVGHPTEDLELEELRSSFESPLDFLKIKSQTVKQIINILSYQGNEPTEGDYFVYTVSTDSYIYGQITEEVNHENRILEGNHYKYNVLAFGSELSEHDLVKSSGSNLIRPRHSSSLELFKTEPFFN